jgi:hypothetical protein
MGRSLIEQVPAPKGGLVSQGTLPLRGEFGAAQCK